MKHVTTDIDYDAERKMWCVTVYVNGHWDSEHWYYSLSAAESFAEQRKLWEEA
jgi:hypothetical protein